MNSSKQDNLWRNYDDTGKPLYTQVPNALMNALVSGHFKEVEAKIILFICRMSHGFRRDETNYLGADDFKEAIGIQKTHFSKNIRQMLKDGVIFRGKESGGKFKYAINLLSYGCRMKHYKFVEDGYELGAEEYTFDSKCYLFSNCSEPNVSGIVYKPAGFDCSEKLYIKEDRKLERKLDTKKEPASVRGSLGALTVEAGKDNIVKEDIVGNLRRREKELEELLTAFEAELTNCPVGSASMLMFKHMNILDSAGYGAGLVSLRFIDFCDQGKKNNKGESFNPRDFNDAMRNFTEDKKR